MEKYWFVLVTKPMHEKKISNLLNKAKIESYCPTIKEVRIWKDRKKIVEVPLFKSYVFVKLTEKKRNSVFFLPGIERYLFWLGKPAIIRDKEMSDLRSSLELDGVEEVFLSGITLGSTIRVKQGTFKDMVGEVKQVSKKRISIALENLGVTVNIKIRDAIHQ